MDLTMLLRERKCLVDVIQRHWMHKQKQVRGSGTEIKESFKLFES